MPVPDWSQGCPSQGLKRLAKNYLRLQIDPHGVNDDDVNDNDDDDDPADVNVDDDGASYDGDDDDCIYCKCTLILILDQSMKTELS